jgi:hypothetical protein
MLPYRLPRAYGLVPNDLRSRGSRFKEALFLDDPAVAKDLDFRRPGLSILSPLLALHYHGVAARSLEDDLVSDLRLGKRLGDGALDILGTVALVDGRPFIRRPRTCHWNALS